MIFVIKLIVGVQVGIVVGMPLSGVLAHSFGWETLFYVFGGLGTFWFITWSFLIKGKYFIVETKTEEAGATKEFAEELNGDGKVCLDVV